MINSYSKTQIIQKSRTFVKEKLKKFLKREFDDDYNEICIKIKYGTKIHDVCFDYNAELWYFYLTQYLNVKRIYDVESNLNLDQLELNKIKEAKYFGVEEYYSEMLKLGGAPFRIPILYSPKRDDAIIQFFKALLDIIKESLIGHINKEVMEAYTVKSDKFELLVHEIILYSLESPELYKIVETQGLNQFKNIMGHPNFTTSKILHFFDVELVMPLKKYILYQKGDVMDYEGIKKKVSELISNMEINPFESIYENESITYSDLDPKKINKKNLLHNYEVTKSSKMAARKFSLSTHHPNFFFEDIERDIDFDELAKKNENGTYTLVYKIKRVKHEENEKKKSDYGKIKLWEQMDTHTDLEYKIVGEPIKGVFEISMKDDDIIYKFPENGLSYYGFDARTCEIITKKGLRIPVMEYYDEERDIHLFMDNNHHNNPRDFKTDLEHRSGYLKTIKF